MGSALVKIRSGNILFSQQIYGNGGEESWGLSCEKAIRISCGNYRYNENTSDIVVTSNQNYHLNEKITKKNSYPKQNLITNVQCNHKH